jgi:translation elongation factor EF-Tu-like GTPase
MKPKVFKITAKIEIIPYEQGGRKTNILSGYRPTFYFIDTMGTSGAIIFYNKPFISPTDKTEVDIYFSNDKYLGTDLEIGKEFLFKEGGRTMGKGIVLFVHGYVSEINTK